MNKDGTKLTDEERKKLLEHQQKDKKSLSPKNKKGHEDVDESDGQDNDAKKEVNPLFNLSEKQSRYCYAMCKMTIALESTEGIKQYDALQFVEFLELLGRIATIQFEGTPF